MIEAILDPECPEGRASAFTKCEAIPHGRSAAESKPRPSVATREGQQGRSGDRRHDRRGLSCLQAGALAEDCHCNWRRKPQGVPQGGPLSPLLANIALDPLDKELESRGHQFARYADDFIVLVKSANAAKRVLAALIRYTEGRLKLIVNRAKSRAAPLKQCAFLGYRIGHRGKLVWTEKVQHRFKERVREWERSGHRVSGGEPREG